MQVAVLRSLPGKRDVGKAILLVDKCPLGWAGGNGYFTAGAYRTAHAGLTDLITLLSDPPSPEEADRIDISPYTCDDFKADIMRLSKGRSDPALVETLVKESRDTIEWLAKKRVDKKFWGGIALAVKNGGKGLIATHQQAMAEAGIVCWFEAPVTSILMTEGAVCGVRLENDGEKVDVKAHNVILAAGGFEANAELRACYLGPGWEKAKVRGTPYNTGDGFSLAKEVGAKICGDWTGCHSAAWDADAPSNAGMRDLTNQHTKSGYPLGIMVNMDGKRFVDEGEDYRNYTYAKFGRAILSQPGSCAFQIWDSQTICRLREEEYGDGVVEKVFADSISELASRLVEKGLRDGHGLVLTVNEFNKAVRLHRKENATAMWDPVTKDGLSTQSKAFRLSVPKTNWALTFDQPPFMAVKVTCGITFTFGGVAIDPCTAGVISEATGKTIEGLYCTGEMVGGLFYDNYPGGSGLTAGAVFGRKAGKAAGMFVTSSVSEQDSSQDLVSPTSPAARTGPPRSLSFSFTSPGSPSLPRLRRQDTVQGLCEAGEFSFSSTGELRGALECVSPRDKKGKGRATTVFDDTIHIHDSPAEEHSGFDFSDGPNASDVKNTDAEKEGKLLKSPDLARVLTQRTSSTRCTDSPQKGWARLRSLLPRLVERGPSAATLASQKTSINITDELIGSGLSTLMLGLWFQRDEKGRRRIPVLLHRLRIHISDSVNPMHIHESAFRIECEYANGAARWVIYRELRDFLHLHAHYALSNVYNRNVDNLPDFPRSSIQWKILKKDDTQATRAEFARKQRHALENYLLHLMRAVMFLPCGNRLSHFLELSTLFLSLAQTGGIQLKAGFMKIRSVAGGGGGFGRKSASLWDRSEYRWCAVRDSYLVVTDEPGEDGVWDVFLLDSHFEIERPKRYYRQGFNLLRPSSHVNKVPPQPESKFWLHFLPHRLSKIFSCSRLPPNQPDPFQTVLGTSVSLNEFPSHLPTPMLDPSTNITPFVRGTLHPNGNGTVDEKKWNGSAADVSKHTFFIINSQVKLKLHARSERQMLQWINALQKTMTQCHYAGKNRFGSFAPVRLNVAAQWLVDGRDYFWNLSRAILLARECIYIHDWWLSPELQMRRPDKSHYRLDHLLERKAEEGVKIYIILYKEVSNRTTPIDSNYTKRKLTNLHPNIMVQRSPSHLQTGTFYWAHHEKLCVIDQTIAFMGGIDLCFGRWDTPQHVLTDDGSSTQSRIWPGKDYSNPRSRDFYDLHKPLEDMYDRSKTPRMPWHDVGLQVVGQPARDLARHFIQRWNWLLRIKNHSREMPCLLPPPEFRENELSQMGLTGTCELQVCRSAGPWSLGTLGHVEHSIQNAYIEAIEHSEHFVYIENQFFITSTIVNETRVENKLGDVLVNRIIRANREKTPWKCCIIIPLLPGFTFPVDHPDASALRIILDCQNRTLFWGPHSIMSRLRKENIDPDNYISIFSLRNWGKSRDDTLMTEQVYIHSKICIVDDRLAIIGSANINERSQRGDRDSEIAAIVRDTDLVDGYTSLSLYLCSDAALNILDSLMAGKQFKVGRFAHSLRIRLMQEHIGIDVDALNEDSFAINGQAVASHQSSWNLDAEQERTAQVRGRTARDARDSVGQALDNNCEQVAGFTCSSVPGLEDAGFKRDSASDASSLPIKKRQHHDSESPTCTNGMLTKDFLPLPTNSRENLKNAGSPPDSTLNGYISRPRSMSTVPTRRPRVEPCHFEDPVTDAFWRGMWMASAIHNTEIYRKVFHPVPDDTITTWKQYKELFSHQQRKGKMYGSSTEKTNCSTEGNIPNHEPSAAGHESLFIERHPTKKSGIFEAPQGSTNLVAPGISRKSTDEPDPPELEKMLCELNGHLVLYPMKFLEGEVMANNFLFNADKLLPLLIYD
ncbi:hypothetical protein APHAL10511_002557 [Amanita phalloides]|nr:hypothetical protein APHAL10511_002557 [Amanita phalloides]